MAKADSSKKSTNSGTPRGKGTYVPACNVCKQKKSKCDTNRPYCQPCIDDNREAECSWSGVPARPPRTEAAWEAMRRRADSLQEYANLLESMIEKCRVEHGGFTDFEAYRQFRPADADGIILPDEMVSDDEAARPAEGGKTIRHSPGRLSYEAGRLYFHGNTAVFRFVAQSPAPASRFPAGPPDPKATYTLMVEGADLGQCDPNFDWARHLPGPVPFDRWAHDTILDLVFKFFTSWCLRIVPALFLRDMYRALSGPRSRFPPQTAHYSPMLHNALLALGMAFSDDPRVRDLGTRQRFAAVAKQLMETECTTPNLSVVQALSILGSFHSSQGEQTLGYLYFGMSARMCQALGLGINCAAWVRAGLISEHDMLDRYWGYWTTFTQDVCWSLYVGRDFGIPPPSQQPPVPFVDADFDEWPWVHAPAHVPAQPNYLSRTFAASCQLLMISRRIMSVVNNINDARIRHEANYQLVSAIDVELNNWKRDLPSEIDLGISTLKSATPHRLMLHLAYWWLFILLHRPFYRRENKTNVTTTDYDVKQCQRACTNIMELLSTYRSLYSLRYIPVTLVQITFSAGTIFILEAVQALTKTSRVAKGLLEQAMLNINVCISYLAEMGKSWKCAATIGGILKDLAQAELKPLMERRSLPDYLITGNPNPSPHIFRRGRAHRDAISMRMPSSVPQPALPFAPSERWATPSNVPHRMVDASPITHGMRSSAMEQGMEQVAISSPATAGYLSQAEWNGFGIPAFGVDWFKGVLAMQVGESMSDAPFISNFDNNHAVFDDIDFFGSQHGSALSASAEGDVVGQSQTTVPTMATGDDYDSIGGSGSASGGGAEVGNEAATSFDESLSGSATVPDWDLEYLEGLWNRLVANP